MTFIVVWEYNKCAVETTKYDVQVTVLNLISQGVSIDSIVVFESETCSKPEISFRTNES